MSIVKGRELSGILNSVWLIAVCANKVETKKLLTRQSKKNKEKNNYFLPDIFAYSFLFSCNPFLAAVAPLIKKSDQP